MLNVECPFCKCNDDKIIEFKVNHDYKLLKYHEETNNGQKETFDGSFKINISKFLCTSCNMLFEKANPHDLKLYMEKSHT